MFLKQHCDNQFLMFLCEDNNNYKLHLVFNKFKKSILKMYTRIENRKSSIH